MKKIIISALATILFSSVTFAGGYIATQQQEDTTKKKTSKKEVRKDKRTERRNEFPDVVKVQLTNDFPDAKKPVYSISPQFDEVTFTEGKKRLTAYYDDQTNLVGTVQKKLFTELPSKAQAEILKKYPGYSIAEVIKFDDNEDNDSDMWLFNTEFQDEDSYFVEVKKGDSDQVLRVSLTGAVSFFKKLPE